MIIIIKTFLLFDTCVTPLIRAMLLFVDIYFYDSLRHIYTFLLNLKQLPLPIGMILNQLVWLYTD